MYAFSLGIRNISETLPKPVYALLSGLNASTVGIVALAAVQLAEKAICDRLSRILVILGACAGLCYNALWYFPVLMVVGGLVTAIYDGWMYRLVRRVRIAWKNRVRRSRPEEPEEGQNAGSARMECISFEENEAAAAQGRETIRSRKTGPAMETLPRNLDDVTRLRQSSETETEQLQEHVIRVRVGIVIMVLFFGKCCSPLCIAPVS